MKKKPTPMKKSPVDLKVREIIKYLQDTDNCHIEGPESGRTMLIKMAPFVLGKGAAADQRADVQGKALNDLEEVLRGSLRFWYEKVKTAEDAVAAGETEKAEAQKALESASEMITKQDEEIEKCKASVTEATQADKEAAKALRKASGPKKTSDEDLKAAAACATTAETAKAKAAAATEALKAAQAAKKSLVAAEKDAEKAIAKKGKAVANAQGHLAVEQVGLEKVQSVFAKFKALRDRKAKSPKKPKTESDVEGEDTPVKSPRPSILDRVASSILGLSPKPEPTE